MHVTLVVLGDLGRSPRMKFHAQSFAEHGCDIDFVGYDGSTLPPSIMDNDRIRLRFIRQAPSMIDKMPNLVKFILKFMYLSIALFCVLIFSGVRTDMIMMQNPPGIPTMAIVWLVCKLRSAKFVIDWHNYTYSILRLSSDQENPLMVRFAKKWEAFFGRKADLNFCVTKAMAADLESRWSIDGAVVLHDCPGEQFRPISVEDKHDLWMRLSSIYPTFQSVPPSEGETCFTVEDEATGRIVERLGRPAILVSSTSWTPDEDFGLLLAALGRYEDRAVGSPELRLPDLVVIITGKGPLKDHYKEEMAKLPFSKIRFVTPWLSPLDYPLLLGAADVGVSLHSSSSGLDLPMKVVDMQGCGLAILALSFNCIGELIEDGKSGLLFSSEAELASLLVDCLKEFPANRRLAALRRYWEDSPKAKWSENWDKVVVPVIFP